MLLVTMALEGGVCEAAVTLMVRSTESAAVLVPQHFTWRVCCPLVATTAAVKEVGSIVVEPLSIEYPIEPADSEPQETALAVRVKGEVT